MMPFVTEEIWGYLPGRDGLLAVAEFPQPDPALVDREAARVVETGIERVRQVRRWRDLVGVPAAAVLEARIDGELEFVSRLARLAPGEGAEPPLATIGSVQILAGSEIDRRQVESRIEAERGRLAGEIERLERKLANRSFAAKAPSEVVEAERHKLDRYRAELSELG